MLPDGGTQVTVTVRAHVVVAVTVNGKIVPFVPVHWATMFVGQLMVTHPPVVWAGARIPTSATMVSSSPVITLTLLLTAIARAVDEMRMLTQR